MDNRDLRFLNQIDHSTDSGFDLDGSSIDELMSAAQNGVIDGASCVAELARRIPGTGGDADARGILTACITALKAMMDSGVVVKAGDDCNGNLVRLWALAVKRSMAMGGPMVVVNDTSNLEVSLAEADLAAVAKAKLKINRAPTEATFDTAIYVWSTLAHSLGIMPLEISSHFVFEAAHSLRMKHKENFWTAQEYLIECFDLIDRKVCKAGDVANHDRNLVVDKARRLGAAFEEAHARKAEPAAAPVEGGGKVWNQRFQHAKSKANLCQSYNRNHAHDNPKHLTADGTCRFRHLCNHWVSDKGPSGRCLRPDCAYWKCNNPAKCDAPLE